MKNVILTMALTLTLASSTVKAEEAMIPTAAQCGPKEMIMHHLRSVGAIPVSRAMVGIKLRTFATNRFGAFFITEEEKEKPKQMCILAYVPPPGTIPVEEKFGWKFPL